MSLPANKTGGYVLHPDGGEAHASFVGGGSFVIKATAEQTGGKFAAVEFWGPRGFGSPIHVHRDDDEFFVVLEGEVRFRLGDEDVDVGPRSALEVPRGLPEAAIAGVSRPAFGGSSWAGRESGIGARSRR